MEHTGESRRISPFPAAANALMAKTTETKT